MFEIYDFFVVSTEGTEDALSGSALLVSVRLDDLKVSDGILF